MPMATKSGQVTGPHQGDVMTHIFRINTDPLGEMFTEDGAFVALNEDGEAAVTMDFACQKCHLTASLDELALFADGFHDPDKALEDIGLDPGLTGTWSSVDRSGEGILLEVGYAPDGSLFMFASFYTYGPDGGQVYLLAESTAIDGTTTEVVVYMTDGTEWGEDFVPGDVNRPIWGSGTFMFPKCASGAFVVTPNADMVAKGYTEVGYDLTRALDSGVACPTFINNELAAAAGN